MVVSSMVAGCYYVFFLGVVGSFGFVVGVLLAIDNNFDVCNTIVCSQSIRRLWPMLFFAVFVALTDFTRGGIRA